MHDDEPVYETPHMDRMAQHGKRFMQTYSTAATCAPSRAAYMAGQYPANTGVFHVYGGRLARPWSNHHPSIDPFYASRLPLDRPIIADISRMLAKETGSQLLDIRKAFIDYLEQHNPKQAEKGILTNDSVHMNEAGNRFLSELVLKALAVPLSTTQSGSEDRQLGADI